MNGDHSLIYVAFYICFCSCDRFLCRFLMLSLTYLLSIWNQYLHQMD